MLLDEDDLDAVRREAEAAGIEALRGADLPRFAFPRERGRVPLEVGFARALRDDASVDFGRLRRRPPGLVLRPAQVEQLSAALALLTRLGVPAVVRGAGHSSGGQGLTDGVVLDLRHLAGLEIDDDGGRARVGGGAEWIDLARALMPRGLRPEVLTSNPRTTVGGTLAVGGFGDTSHRFGLQIDGVQALTLALPTGEVREVGPDDELFRYALAGRGQLGVIASATLRCVRASARLRLRPARWPSLAAFLDDAAALLGFDFVRARLVLPAPGRPLHVAAAVGDLVDDGETGRDPRRYDALSAVELGAEERMDLAAHLEEPLSPAWAEPCPALELSLPLPEGAAFVEELARCLTESGLDVALPTGCAAVVLGGRGALPLAPLPEGERCLLLAIRPAIPLEAARLVLPLFEALARDALDLGGRLYLMSAIEPDAELLARSFGGDLERWRELKRRWDPAGILGGGLLGGRVVAPPGGEVR